MLGNNTTAQSSLLRQAPAKGQHPGLYVFGTASSLGMAMFINLMAASSGGTAERRAYNA